MTLRRRSQDPGTVCFLERMLDKKAGGTSLISEYVQSMSTLPLETSAELTLTRLYRGVPSAAKVKASFLQEQMKKMDEKFKADYALMDDIQDFFRNRARLDAEYADKINKLALQTQQKRKLASSKYKEGAENITLSDLFRVYVEDSFKESKERQAASEKVLSLTGDAYDARKEEKKGMQKMSFKILTNLQDELSRLEQSVGQAKKQYDAAMKELYASRKKNKKKKDDKSDVIEKRLISKAQFARNEYLLELAAANSHYLKFRNQQLPEVMDTVTQQQIEFLKEFYHMAISVQTVVVQEELANFQKVRDLTELLTPEFERHAFIDESRTEFPERCLFNMEPYEDDDNRDLVVDENSRMVLLQLRKLLEHRVDTIKKELQTKEQQIESLQSLQKHAKTVGDLDKQAHSMQERLQQTIADTEALAIKKSHLDAKILKITSTGIDEGGSLNGDLANLPVLDMAEAQAREEARRSGFYADSPASSPNIARKSLRLSDRVGIDSSDTDTPLSPIPERESARQGSVSLTANQMLMSMAALGSMGGGSGSQPVMSSPAMAVNGGSAVGVGPSSLSTSSLATASSSTAAPGSSSSSSAAAASASTPAGNGMQMSIAAAVAAAASKSAEAQNSRKSQDDVARAREEAMAAADRYARQTGNFADRDWSSKPPVTKQGSQLSKQSSQMSKLGSQPELPPLPPLPDADDEEEVPPALPPLPPLPENLDDDILDGEAPPPLPPMPVGVGAFSGFAHKPSVQSNFSFGSGVTDEIEEAEMPLQYRALYDYKAVQADDVNLTQGEIVYVLVVRDDGWMQGLNSKAELGYFPQTYVHVVDTEEESTGYRQPRIVEFTPTADGVGFTMKGTAPINVDQVVPGSAAEIGGLLPNDIILEVNNEPCADVGVSGLTSLLVKGGPRSPIRLCVLSQPLQLP